MQTEFNKDKVLARVKKMLTLANDAGASEGERDNAMRMAHATLAKYNLSLSEAEAVGNGNNDEPREDAVFVTSSKSWMRRCAHAVSTLFFCKYFFVNTRDGKVKHYVIGRASNVMTATYIAEFVISSIRKEARARSKDELHPGAFRLSFAKGATDCIWQRVQQLMRDADSVNDTPKATGTSLTIASLYQREAAANSDYLTNKMGIKLTARKTREKMAGHGYSDGHQFGKSVSLNRQVGGAAQKQLQ